LSVNVEYVQVHVVVAVNDSVNVNVYRLGPLSPPASTPQLGVPTPT
jgi:hypothetical protein